MDKEDMRRMLVHAHAVIANAENLLRNTSLPYGDMVHSQAEVWLDEYQALLSKEAERLFNPKGE